jgi:hypothetical protein
MVLTDDLVAYWKADTNGSFLDETDNNNDGTISGATYTSSGKINGCYDFDGTNDYVYNNGASLKGISNDISVSLWVKAPEQSNDWASIVGRGTWTETGCYDLAFKKADGSLGRYFRMEVYELSPNTCDSTTNIQDNQWHHIAGVIDDTAKKYYVYVDGVLEGDCSFTGTLSAHSTKGISLGARNYADRFYDGLIDEVGIWNRVLTSDEISDLYNSGTGLSYPFTSSGWDGKILGKNYSEIAKVNNVAKANIVKINGVDVS